MTQKRLNPDKKLVEDSYLGDGVYASYDGWHIWLDTRAQDPCHRIALDPTVLRGLDAYRKKVIEALKDQQREADSAKT